MKTSGQYHTQLSISRPARGVCRLVHRVQALSLGEATTFSDGTLVVGTGEAVAMFADSALATVRVRTASPGEPVRIVKLLDVVEPRTKGPAGGVFPGFLGPPLHARPRETHVLRGAAVMAAGYLPRNQEGVVDMSGPGAELSPYSLTHNVVVEFEPAEGATWERVDAALRQGLLRLAVHLADAATSTPPDEVEDLPGPTPPPRDGGLPRVGAVTNLQSQGTFKDVFVYGRSMATSLPTLIDPGEVDDGAVVSGQFGHPALRNSTWMHQNHPVVTDLRRRHGHDLAFAGLVLCPEPVEQRAKEHVSAHVTALCVAAGFDTVVVTKEGGGNADTDMSLKLDMLEEAGLTAVGIYAEMSGLHGTGVPVVAPPRQATAMVSVGNYDQRVRLPAVDRALGGGRVDIADADATADLELPMGAVHGSLNPLGWGHLTCREMS